MWEIVQIVIGILFLISVFLLTRLGIMWKLRRAARSILKDLESQDAVDVLSAVDLPYSKPDFFRIGMRDYRHKALGFLVDEGAIGKTGSNKYYVLARTAVD